MTALLLYVLRNLERRRSRTIIGALGIFLTVGLLTAIQIGLDSVSTSYIDLVALQAGKADLLITKQGGNPLTPEAFDPAQVQARMAANPLLNGVSGRLVGLVQVRLDQTEHYAVLLGLDPKREKDLDISGLVPEPALGTGNVVVSQSLADKLKTKPGAKLDLYSPGADATRALRLEGIVERQLLLPQQVRDFVVVNLADARILLKESDRVHVLAGALRQPRTYYDARDLHASALRIKKAGEALAADLGMDYEVRLPKAAAIMAFQNFTSPLRAVFGVFALLSLAITGLLIYSLISVAVEERIREYAILRALGARRGKIVGLVLTESLLLCFLGVVPGIGAGFALAWLIVSLVELAMKTGAPVIALEISPATLWLTWLAGVLLSTGSALIPAFHAIRWKIVDAMDPLRRGQIPAKTITEGQASRPLVATGLVLSALSVVVFFVLPTAFLSGNPSLIGTVVLGLLLAILLGFTLVMMGALPIVERLVLRCVGWTLGPSAAMVGKNLERHRRRNTTTALMFTLSVSLVIFIASLAALFSRTSLAMVEHSYGADIRIHTDSVEQGAAKASLAGIEGVEAVAEARFLRGRSDVGIAYDVVISDLVGMKQLWIVPFGVDPELSTVLFTNQISSEAGSPLAIAALSHYGIVETNKPIPANRLSPVILSLSVARFLEVGIDDVVQLSFRLGSERSDARFQVAAIYGSLPGFENFRGRIANAVGSGVLMSLENFKTMTRTAPAEALQAFYFIKAKGNESVQKAVARKVREAFDVRYRFGVQCAAEQKEQARILYWATQVFFGLMLVVAVTIAVFALIAAMASTVIERRREIGVLKALGLRRRQLFLMFLGEAVVLTLSAGLAGGAIGFSLAYLFMLQAAVLIEVKPVFTLPYVTFLATFIISIIAGALAAYLPTRRLLTKSAAEILRFN